VPSAKPSCASASLTHALRQRFGPRPIDLDIIAYGSRRVDTPELTVPHPRLSERPFVLAPVADLAAGTTGPAAHIAQLWQRSGGESQVGRAGLARVLALPGGIVWPVGGRTRVMAVLNVTPDSFSDDGCTGVAQAVAAGLRLVEQGADVVDVGGQSTRPGAVRVSAEEEARRVLPVLRALREQLPPGVLLSVDTFYGSVASSAIAQGAHIVNDVSGGGRFDHTLLAAVADSDAAYVLMHSRGESDTMQRPEFTRYADVVKEVAVELRAAGERCVAAGIEPWRIVLDPGIGFAKDKDSNLQLLRNLPAVRPGAPGALRNAPLLVGPSRKGFLGSLAGGRPPAERDWATAAAVAACVAGGAELVRVHNVAAMRDVVAVADAIHRKLRDERRG